MIIHPLRPRILGGIVLAVIFVIWLVSVCIALPSFIYADTLSIEYCQGTRVVCYLDWPDGNYGTVDFWCVSAADAYSWLAFHDADTDSPNTAAILRPTHAVSSRGLASVGVRVGVVECQHNQLIRIN